MVKPDGVLQIRNGKLQIVDNNEMAAGNVAMLQDAKAEIDRVGFDKTLEGSAGASTSGRAVQLNQQAGSMEVAYLFDGIKMWQKAVYETCWRRVKQFWSDEKWVRVTEDPENTRFVGLNVPETTAEGIPTGRVINDVGRLHVDIDIQEAPDIPNIQAEQFTEILRFLSASGQNIGPM